jgi:hypothetical protein
MRERQSIVTPERILIVCAGCQWNMNAWTKRLNTTDPRFGKPCQQATCIGLCGEPAAYEAK